MLLAGSDACIIRLVQWHNIEGAIPPRGYHVNFWTRVKFPIARIDRGSRVFYKAPLAHLERTLGPAGVIDAPAYLFGGVGQQPVWIRVNLLGAAKMVACTERGRGRGQGESWIMLVGLNGGRPAIGGWGWGAPVYAASEFAKFIPLLVATFTWLARCRALARVMNARIKIVIGARCTRCKVHGSVVRRLRRLCRVADNAFRP